MVPEINIDFILQGYFWSYAYKHWGNSQESVSSRNSPHTGGENYTRIYGSTELIKRDSNCGDLSDLQITYIVSDLLLLTSLTL